MVVVFDKYTRGKVRRLEKLGFRCVDLPDRVECYKKLNEIQNYVVVLEKWLRGYEAG
jgi:hypothetical protein